MKLTGIYQIKSKCKPERIYIGSAKNINNRWCGHLSSLRKNRHHSIKLQNHYNKYTENDFEFTILLICNKEDLIKEEQKFIDLYSPYFNICKIAYSCIGRKCTEENKIKSRLRRLGKKLSEETKLKISIGNKGKILPVRTEEHTRKIVESRKGYIHSKETRLNISYRTKGEKNPMYGKHFSDESKQKMRNTLGDKLNGKNNPFYGKQHSLETKLKMKEVWIKRKLINKNMKYSQIFEKILPIVLLNEGGYSDVEFDLGGATNYGITQRVYDLYRTKNGKPLQSVMYITQDEVQEIYWDMYWSPMKLDSIDDEASALEIFDMGVNSGIGTAAKMAQRIVNAIPDGVIGPKTILAINNYNKDFVTEYKEARRMYYVDIVINRPTNIKFLKGWLKRVYNNKFK